MAATAAPLNETSLGRSSQWARQYPPLLTLVVALLIALIVLPSSLNVPQSNPATTLEFAPVPPEDDTPPPPVDGNFSSLGLAGSSNLTSGGAPGGDQGGPGDDDGLDDALGDLPPPLDAPGGVGKSPRTKNCVGNPPRQTEDPLSPPCVADFSGDNGGKTYQGVSAEEVKILIYLQGFTRNTNSCRDPNQVTPDNEYFDLAQPPEPGEHCYIYALRVWQQYFNERYQAYGRFVHFYVYVSGQGATAEERKADAADNYAKVKPFAVISLADGFADAYLETMAKRGVLAFEATFGRKAEFFQKNAPRIWNYQPSLEQYADNFIGMLCTKVAGKPVAVTGNPQQLGQPRKYGLIYTADPGFPQNRELKDYVKAGIAKCGIEFSAEATYPGNGYVQDNRYPPTYAQTAMADFQSKGITTIIWPGGLETNFSKSGAQLNYRPEVILLGDLLNEADISGTFQEASFWANTTVMSTVTFVPDERRKYCFVAYREGDPNADDTDARVSGCQVYDQLRQLFTGIQVAGPRLTPESMDKGFHAIPKIRSTDPQVPACFYEPSDYTCIKDAILERWDPAGDDGCYRVLEGGARYTATTWKNTNIDAEYDPATAPCNDYDSTFVINPNPPDAGI